MSFDSDGLPNEKEIVKENISQLFLEPEWALSQQLLTQRPLGGEE